MTFPVIVHNLTHNFTDMWLKIPVHAFFFRRYVGSEVWILSHSRGEPLLSASLKELRSSPAALPSRPFRTKYACQYEGKTPSWVMTTMKFTETFISSIKFLCQPDVY